MKDYSEILDFVLKALAVVGLVFFGLFFIVYTASPSEKDLKNLTGNVTHMFAPGTSIPIFHFQARPGTEVQLSVVVNHTYHFKKSNDDSKEKPGLQLLQLKINDIQIASSGSSTSKENIYGCRGPYKMTQEDPRERSNYQLVVRCRNVKPSKLGLLTVYAEAQAFGGALRTVKPSPIVQVFATTKRSLLEKISPFF